MPSYGGNAGGCRCRRSRWTTCGCLDRTSASAKSKISASGVQVYYGTNHALKDVSVEILDKAVTAFIGPSGCGKSTFLRCLNRMNDTVASAKVSGQDPAGR